MLFIVGMTGFEPATPRPPGVCATGLRYIPNLVSSFEEWAKVVFFRYLHKPKKGLAMDNSS